MPSNFGSELYFKTGSVDRVYEEEAIIQCIQNLCFFKPGTFPNDPDIGLGIEDEQFELIDNNYVSNLKMRLDSMIEKYIITDYYIDTRVSFKYVDAVSSKKVLIIEVFVGEDSSDLTKIDLLFTRTEPGNKLVFKIWR